MPSPTHSPARPGLALEALALAAIVVAVFGGSLAYFFSQDDFAGLARVRGLIPALDGPWRYVPGQLYFELMEHLAGTNPLPYRIASLGLHAVNALLVRALVGRWLPAPAAWLAAACFAAHPAPFTALYWISGVGDLMGLGFALATALVATRTGRSRWLAAPLFMLSLCSKEAVILVPLWIALARRMPPRHDASTLRAHRIDPLDAVLAALSAAYLVWFLDADTLGLRSALPGPSAYEVRFDGTLIGNLLTYAGWTANHFVFTVRGFADAIDPAVFPWGIAALIALVAGAFIPALRQRGWIPGLAWYLALLLPALPLPHHTYHYYLYVALPGAGWCVGALIDFLLLSRFAASTEPSRATAKRREPAATKTAQSHAAAWAVAGAIGLAFAVNGAALVRKIEHYPFVIPELRADPTVDRALIAARARDDLAAASLPPGTRLVFWSPDSLDQSSSGRTGTAEGYTERNVRGALYDGLAARVLFPAVIEARFARSLPPHDAATRYAIYRHDGHLKVVDGATLDSLVRASETR